MHRTSVQIAVLFVCVGVAFLLGRGVDRIDAQDRGGPPTRGTGGETAPDPGTGPRDVLVYEQGGGTSVGANGIIAVTGSYGVGTSVLYVIDTEHKQMAVYEARGGSSSMRRLVLVGARRIDLDLALEGYNDESEFDYRALKQRFDTGKREAEARRPADPTDLSGLRRDR